MNKHGFDVLELLDEAEHNLVDEWQENADYIRSLSLVEFCEQYLWIQDKHDNLVRFIPNRAQRHLANLLDHETRIINLKARQLGISTIIAAYEFKLTLQDGVRSASMAHDDVTTQKLRRMAKVFYENLPEHLQLKKTYDNAGITSYTNLGEVTIKTAGSKVGGRGGTYGGVFHADEAAFWKDADDVFKGAIQGVPTTGTIIIASTPNGTQGLFYDEVQKAKTGDSEYKFVFFEWWWDESYIVPLEDGETLTYSAEEQALVDEHGLSPEQIKWRRKKMNEPGMGEDFIQEYPEDDETCFLTSGESAFPGVHHALIPVSQTAPLRFHKYSAGLDWGQDSDYTSLSIYDETANEEVFIGRWRRMKYKDIRREVIDTCKYWNVYKLTPERNSMASNIEELIDEFQADGYQIDIYPLVMTNPLKHELVTLFKNGYQQLGMKWLDVPYAKQELNTFVKKQLPSLLWTYQAEGKGSGKDSSNARDDTVIARLLTCHGVNNTVTITVSQYA